MIIIDKTTYKAKSFNERIRFLVLHYTEGNLEVSLSCLLGDKVSVHYLASDHTPNHIFQLVDESQSAWHAGISFWQDRYNLNDTAIGIEIVNLGPIRDANGKVIGWHPFPPEQIEAVMELCKDIIARYTIEPTCVIGHADIAPNRRTDPGPLFPWKKLYANGIGAWFDEDKVQDLLHQVDLSNIQLIQRKFAQYGYPIQETGVVDQQTTTVVQAFQMHFRPTNYSGLLDNETVAILEALLQKYFTNTSAV